MNEMIIKVDGKYYAGAEENVGNEYDCNVFFEEEIEAAKVFDDYTHLKVAMDLIFDFLYQRTIHEGVNPKLIEVKSLEECCSSIKVKQ